MKAADLHAVEEAADRAFASATIANLPRWAAEAAADSARVVASAAIGPEALAEVRAAIPDCARCAEMDGWGCEVHQ